MTSSSWYVVRTKPHSEGRAADHLQRQGFGTYLPRYLKQRRHARRIELVRAPLFPSYLFVSFDVDADRWIPIRSTLGAVDLIRYVDGRPIPLPTTVIDKIREQEDGRGLVRLIDRLALRPGDRVAVTRGAFTEQIGHLVSCSDRERVVVLLNILGRDTPLALPAECIAPAA